MVAGEGDDQLWGSGRGAIAGCHCSWGEGRVTTNLSGRGAIAGCPYAAIASRQTALNFLQTLHCSLR